jgi:hypothetical protein
MDKLEIIKSNYLYRDVFEIVLNIGIENLDIACCDYTISFRPKNSDFYDFELVFWLNENRISFNIEDWYEIIDNYLENEKEAFIVFEFIDTIFKYEILIEEFIGNNNKVFKKNLVFTTKMNNQIKKSNNVQILHFKFPWIRLKLSKSIIYKPLY